MSEKRFKLVAIKPGTYSYIWDYEKQHKDGVGSELWMGEVVDKLNHLNEENKQLQKKIIEQQDFINLLFEELLDAQNQGYVVNFTHKNKPCSIIPKEQKE